MDNLQNIQVTLDNLLIRMDDEEGSIDQYLKRQIELILDFYFQQVDEKRNIRKYNDQISLLIKSIKLVRNKLQELPTTDSFQFTVKSERDIFDMKEELFQTEKLVRSNKIKMEDCRSILHKSINYAKNIEHVSRAFSDKQQINLSLMFLRLFLNTPPTKILTNLQNILSSLDSIKHKASTFNIQNVNTSDVKQIELQLNKVISKLDEVKDTFVCTLRSFKETAPSDDPNVVLNQIKNDIRKYYSSVVELQIPFSETSLTQLRNQLSHLVHDRLNKIHNVGTTMQEQKNKLQDNALFVLENLENLKIIDTCLTEVQFKVRQIITSNDDFLQKNVNLEECLRQVQNINTINELLLTRKKIFINKIKGLVAAEAAIYLRGKLGKIENYKSYAQQFAFPRRVSIFGSKRNEIIAMEKDFSCLKSNRFVDNRLKIIEDITHEAVTALERKAGENEETMVNLEKLENIEKDMSYDVRQQRINIFNNYRGKINEIEDSNFRVINKKLEILQILHNFEKDFYVKYFPALASTVSWMLDKYLNFAKELYNKNTDLIETSGYKTAIASWSSETQDNIKTKFFDKVDVLMPVFRVFFDQMKSLVQKQDELNEQVRKLIWIEQQITSTQYSAHIEKTNVLKVCQEQLDTFKTNIKRRDLFKKLSDIAFKISIEKSKAELKNIINNHINPLKTDIRHINISQNSDSIKDKIYELLILKEVVNDMPKGSPELDQEKELVLQEIFSTLATLDEDVAKYLFKKRQFENVLNINEYFSSFRFDNISNKESVEFVHKIHRHASTFADNIKCYLGSKDSMDFYIIHESLMLLLEELDKLACDNDRVLEETTATMKFIKGLQKQLLENASYN